MRHRFFCIDSHTCGNPVRVVAGGAPLLPHLPIFERRDLFLRDHDWVRTALMFEPRGHDIMSGVIIYPAHRTDCDFAALFIEVSGCLPMCGAGTMGVSTVVIEEGLVTPKTPGKLAIETPAGRVDVEYKMNGDRVESVRMFNVPSFLHSEGITVDVQGMGPLTVDISYGGNFYAVVEPQANWSGFDGMSASQIVTHSRALREALAEIGKTVVHPEDTRICGVEHVLWCDGPGPNSDGRDAVFYGDKAIDRSPGGTGTSARIAHHHGKGRLKIGQTFRNESLIGTIFEGICEEEVMVGPYRGIRSSIGGWARIIGHNTILVDDDDPLRHGFMIV
ncbi:4-hydroxyproline epimerase [Paracoccus laeviglucosivorans]|uniref:Proline racemase n=1 Tax=Paracoccus laeviglucosivorans TaxID=1197861 RepID=A0A521ELK3_9RHOB|nr:4-hydroxyproline epimerase [Paracoccus laeviglucosivorans]SMO84803.1 proline racemase [Paracoccus laeviglucosivorans]